MVTYISDICLSPAGVEPPVDLKNAPKLNLNTVFLDFVEPDFKVENVINFTPEFELGTPEYYENLERLKKFHCYLNQKTPFSSLGYLKDEPSPVHENLKLDIDFKAVDLSTVELLPALTQTTDKQGAEDAPYLQWRADGKEARKANSRTSASLDGLRRSKDRHVKDGRDGYNATTQGTSPRSDSYDDDGKFAQPTRTRWRGAMAENGTTEGRSFSRRVERLRNRHSSVLEVAEGKGSRRRRLRQRRDEHTSMQQQDVVALKGSTRLEAKRRRRYESRLTALRQTKITESEFLARRECVDRKMIVREKDGLNQIAVLEDGLLVEHYVARRSQSTSVGNVYLGRVQNVLPSMEAAFVDIGKERNAVLYAGEVNWDELGLEGNVRRIENALKPGDIILVQVTKDPIGNKGARLTSQVTLAGRHIVLVPSGAMTGISKKLPEQERRRLKKILRSVVPDDYGVIVRTAAEGTTAEQIEDDVNRLIKIWKKIESKQKSNKSPMVVHTEPELGLRVIRDIFNEDFKELIISGDEAWDNISKYVSDLSPDLYDRLHKWTDTNDVFIANRVDEQLAKGMDRKVWLPSGGYLIIDRTEAMTVIDVNTGKYIGAGGTLEETITKNNLESAEEIVRQLRLRDIGGIIVIDFVDMILESNRNLVLRRLIECLGRDRTRHQVTEVTSLGLVQMTRKRVGQGLVEAFSSKCDCCDGRGFLVHSQPVDNSVSSKKERKVRKAKSDNSSNESVLDFSKSSKDSDDGSVEEVVRTDFLSNDSNIKFADELNSGSKDNDVSKFSSDSGEDVVDSSVFCVRSDNFVGSLPEDDNSVASVTISEGNVQEQLSVKSKRKKRKRVVSVGTFSPSTDCDSSIIIL